MTFIWKGIAIIIFQTIIWLSILGQKIDCGHTDDHLDRSLEYFMANCKPKLCECLTGLEESCAAYPDVAEMLALNLMMEPYGTGWTSFSCPNFDIWRMAHMIMVEPDFNYILVYTEPRQENITTLRYRFHRSFGEFLFSKENNPKTIKLLDKLGTRALLEIDVKSYGVDVMNSIRKESSGWLSSSQVVSSKTDPYFSTTVFGPLAGRDSLTNEYKLLVDPHPNDNLTFGPVSLIFNPIDVGFDYTFQRNPTLNSITLKPTVYFCMGRKIDKDTGLARWTGKGCRVVIAQSTNELPHLRNQLNREYKCECEFKSISLLEVDDVPEFKHDYKFGIDIPCNDICGRSWMLTAFAYGFMVASIVMLLIPFWYVFYYKT